MNFNSTQHPPVVPPNVCPVCGEPMRRYLQRGFAHIPDSWQEDCQNIACFMRFVTLEAGVHARLTSDQLEAYRVMRSGQLERERDAAISPAERELHEAAALLQRVERLQLFGECG